MWKRSGQVPALVEVQSTASVDRSRRFAAWQEQVRRTCGTLQVLGDHESFGNGSIATSAFGAMRVSVITADPHTVIRQERAATTEGGHVYVAVLLSGQARLSQDGADSVVRSGDILSFDSSRPYTLAMPEHFEMVAARITHRALGVSPRNTRCLSVAPWCGDSGVGALASHTLSALGKHLTELDEAAREPLATTINGLITTLFAERLRSASSDPATARQILMLRIQSFAREHLGECALSPVTLARRYNISLRYLQVLFAEHDTSPARWIRDERLSRLRADLGNPGYDHLTVATIGERWGLVGASQVSRLFRTKYGLTPSEFRKLRAPARDRLAQREQALSRSISRDHAAAGSW
ncbi:MAG: helix-turn-helix domain-containing protein [Actinomycetota bacterium]|nr:helix-turn-helix domain-containing protein [Actinomycetota bacterium]